MPGITLEAAASEFGRAAKAKLSSPAARGEPEDQLRAPLENLFADLAALISLPQGALVMVGEIRLSDLKTRPDFAVSVQNVPQGFLEVKRPGKGADPRNFTGADAEQWEKLQTLPNLIYTDGNEWSLWRYGQLEGEIIKATGDVRKAGTKLGFPHALLGLFENFVKWDPTPPRDAKQLAGLTARLCKLLRYEVLEQLEHKDPALTELAKEWRRLLFPDATDDRFADGYAQAVTFGLLMARARGIKLADGLDSAAKHLKQSNSLIGAALRILTEEAEGEGTLTTSLTTLIRVLDVVNWTKVSKGSPDAWLYFYEDFLSEYDNELRKQTGSYYTPPEVVFSMVRLVDEALVTRFGLPRGLAAPQVTIADPAMGTGTFLLGILNHIARVIAADEGEGAVRGVIESAIDRMVAFEIQLGPFAVAQLRMTAELVTLAGRVPKAGMRMYVADTLANPHVETEDLGALYKPIAESRKAANKVKLEEKITVVIGNPPYKEKAKGLGGWVESGGTGQDAPLLTWMPPANWKVGAHAKHLRNLYVYFWRWATWKVFDQDPAQSTGVVSFITVAGFLNGPGFERMRDYLRRTAGEVWVIDCSPEGQQPPVNSRIFQAVQQPVCIVMASRASAGDGSTMGIVRYRQLPAGPRGDKFKALAGVALDGPGWSLCPQDGRAPFLPAATGAWADYPRLEDLFVNNDSGVMAGRTWIIAPDPESLVRRWDALITAPAPRKEVLFHPHLRGGKVGDKHIGKVVPKGLGNLPARPQPISKEQGACTEPQPYGFRSFDRQWIIPDARLINQPNPEVWRNHSSKQVYLTALTRTSPSAGPALTITGSIPDLDHYNGKGGRVFALWQDAQARHSNVAAGLLALLSQRLGRDVAGEDVLAYIAGVMAHPAFTTRFRGDLVQPGLRIPITSDPRLFDRSVSIGREVIWLHTFGERYTDPARGRPHSSPRMEKGTGPKIPASGAIPATPDDMPDSIAYDDGPPGALLVGKGRIENVPRAVWDYEVSGKQVLTQWFSYRKKSRERPIIGDRRPPSPLGDIQPDRWPAEYTTELINVLHVLGRLVKLEPSQDDLLKTICTGDLIDQSAINTAVQTASTKDQPPPEGSIYALLD